MEDDSYCTAPLNLKQRALEVINFLEAASKEQDGENDWKFIKEQDGVYVSYKPTSGMVHTLRGINSIPTSPESIVEIGKGLEHWDGLDPFYKDGRTVEKIDENNEVIFSVYSAGVPLVADREFLLHETRGKKGNNYFIARDDIKNPENGSNVRGVIERGGFWIEPKGDHCRVVWVVCCDPKGWIPITVANVVCGDEPLVLSKIREAAIKWERERKKVRKLMSGFHESIRIVTTELRKCHMILSTMGEISFRWKYGGNEVLLYGSFNNWKGEKMAKNEVGVWVLVKNLTRGAHEYKFTVDGNWCFDMEQPYLTTNGQTNNVICVDFYLLVPFWWRLAGKKVFVSGTFNNWTAERMDEIIIGEQHISHTFYKELPLNLGYYQYKYISDDRWLYDDLQPTTYSDNTLNNYREVKTGQTELYYFHSGSMSVGLHYLGYLPKDYSNGQKWPLILYLHGSKQRGENIQSIEETGLAKELKNGRSLPFIVLSPQCPRQLSGHLQSRWTSLTPWLLDLLDHFCNTRNVDRSRIYLTGVEMGAYGVWKLATERNNKFAAIAPFSGVIGGDSTKAGLLTHIPLWATDNKFCSSFSDTEEMVRSIQNQGGNKVVWIVKESGKSDSWSETYAGDDLYRWFEQQALQEKNN